MAVLREGEKPLWRRVHTDSSYLSASDVRVHLGLGEKPAIQSLLVEWPDGSKERFDAPQPDRLLTLRQGAGKPP